MKPQNKSAAPHLCWSGLSDRGLSFRAARNDYPQSINWNSGNIVSAQSKSSTPSFAASLSESNACAEALSIAEVCGADFIRCNVVIGAYVTDQGIIQGCAAELARLRRSLGSDVLIFGDVHVKHAHPLFDVPIEYAAQDLAERGGVDAVIVSGPRSPIPPTWERLATVKEAVQLPVLIGSGIGLANVKEFYDKSDGVLIGEPDFKVGGVWGGESDEAAYAEAVRLCRG